MKKFAITGVAGFIAPKHIKAIYDTGNDLIAALDPSDSVGILDSYFPNSYFFTESKSFHRHLQGLKSKKQPCDFLSICVPNYLHYEQILLGLRLNCDVICEKPIVLNPWNVGPIEQLEKETGKRVYNVLQLRLHPSIIELKKKVETNLNSKIFDVDLAYITSRGKWYHRSWKGNSEKSGGIATNIGIHFFDMLYWIFGNPIRSIVHVQNDSVAAGFLELDRARVRWFLSIKEDNIPSSILKKGLRSYRSLEIEKEEFEFSNGFNDLHTEIYNRILTGKGYTVQDAIQSIEIVHQIRTANPVGLIGDYHPLLSKKF